MADMLVELDDKVVKASITDKGLTMTSLNQEAAETALFEAGVLDNRLDKLFDNDFNRLTNEVYAETLTSLKQNIKKTVLRTLGFEDRYSGWEVDHCNGRMSDVTSLISEKVRTAFREQAEQVIEAEGKTLFTGLHPAIRKEFKEEFLKVVRANIRETAHTAAKKFLSVLMADETKKYEAKALQVIRETLVGDDYSQAKKKPAKQHPLNGGGE